MIKKNYIAEIGNDSIIITAVNLKAAKQIAQFHKRQLKWKGVTSVRILSN